MTETKTLLAEGELISVVNRISDPNTVIEVRIKTSNLTKDELGNLHMNIKRNVKVVVFPAPKLCTKCRKPVEYSDLLDVWKCDSCGVEIDKDDKVK